MTCRRTLLQLCPLGKHLVQRGAGAPGQQPQVERGVGLGIEVQDQGLVPFQGQRRRQVDRRGGLAHSAFLVQHRDPPHRRSLHGRMRSGRACWMGGSLDPCAYGPGVPSHDGNGPIDGSLAFHARCAKVKSLALGTSQSQ